MALEKLTQKRVREVFDYREDGQLTWKVSTTNCRAVGDIAGYKGNKGYVRVMLDNVEYVAHRIVWLWHHGYLPELGIDHIDRDKANNRLENLREVGQVCNTRNTGNRSSNSSGVKGVCWHKESKKWIAQITISGKVIYLGVHSDFLEAVCHRLAAEQAEGWAGCDDCSPAFLFVKNSNKK